MEDKNFTKSELYDLAVKWKKALDTFNPTFKIETYVSMLEGITEHKLLGNMIDRYNTKEKGRWSNSLKPKSMD